MHRPQRPPLHPAADARGDGHVPRARDPVVQGAAAALVPLPDEGPRRAAAARRPPPGARVHHEGRATRSTATRRASRRSFENNREAYHRIFERCGVEAHRRPGRERDHGRQVQHRLPRAVGLGREHARHAASAATTRPTSRSRRAVPRAPEFPAPLGKPEEVETPGVDDDRGARRVPRRSTPRATSKAMPVVDRGRRGSCSRSCAATTASASRSSSTRSQAARGPPTDEEIRAGVRRRRRLARPGRVRGRGRSPTRRCARAVRRRREPRRLAPARRRGRARLRAAVRRHPRAARGRPLPELRRRAPVPDRDRGRPHLQLRRASTPSRSARPSSTRTAPRSRSSAAATGSARAA